jgi:hypothetical protein
MLRLNSWFLIWGFYLHWNKISHVGSMYACIYLSYRNAALLGPAVIIKLTRIRKWGTGEERIRGIAVNGLERFELTVYFSPPFSSLVQKPNSWTYDLVEVSGHKILRVLRLEVSAWISWTIEKGLWSSIRFSSFIFYSVQYLNFINM